MEPLAFGITIGLLVVTAAAAVFVWTLYAKQKREGVGRQERSRSLESELAQLRTQTELALERQRSAEQMLTKAQDTFDALAGKALKQSNEQFLQLAEQRFKAEQGKASEQLEARQKAIEQLVQPVKETLEKYNKSLNEIEAARKGAYEALTKDLELFRQDQRRLREETGNLVKALRRPEVRGRWGEMQLRRVVELAGMIEHCDFSEQQTIAGSDGMLRPDLIVHLPSDRTIVVDAKTPIDAYIDAVESDDDASRQRNMERHAGQIEAKVRDLSAKAYQQQFDRAPSFVVLFIPGESFLQPAAQLRPALIENAMQRGVVIATPSTLITLLRAVALGWREERLAENAERISREASELHGRICTMAEHIAKLGDALRKATEGYNRFVSSLDRRVMPSVRKLEGMHAKSGKDLTDLPQVDINVQKTESLALPEEVKGEA